MLTEAEKEIKQIKTDFESLQYSTKHRFHGLETEISNHLNTMRTAYDQYSLELDKAQAGSKRSQLESFLDQFLVRDASLPGITNQRVISLESFGIETAYDIELLNQQKVPGIGPVLSGRLFDWRNSLAQRFVPSATLPANERARINAKYAPALLPTQQLVVTLFDQMNSLKKEHSQKLQEIEDKLKISATNAATAQAHLIALHNLN